jgi:hypothetical protein
MAAAALVLLGGTCALADGWKAGVARATITPKESMWMAGYAARTGPSEGTIHDLWCKALALEDDQGRRVVLVSLDLCGISRPLSDEVRDELQAKHGLGRHAIVLACSHTHTGPVTRENLITMYRLDEAQARKVQEYSKVLQKTIVATVAEAMQALGPVEIAWGTGRADFAVNRRENKEADVPKLREDVALKGPNDFDLPVLRVAGADGSLRAIVFGYACHCTVLSLNQFSGDYAGSAQMEVEKAHPGATALFVAGCGADQNPLPRRTVELAQQYGAKLAGSVEKVLSGPMRPVGHGLNSTYEEVELSFASLPSRADWQREAESSNVSIAQRAKAYLARIDAGQPVPSTYPYPVQAWRLGDELTWVLLGGEVVVDYSLRLKRNLGPSTTWVSAYCNDVMAYIPSERVLTEGGYEGDTSMVPYGLPSKWESGTEERIIDAVARRVRAVGRR